MKNMRLKDLKIARKWALPAGIVALGLASIVMGQQHNTGGSKAAVIDVDSARSQTGAKETPAPTVKPDITVNGTAISTDEEGSKTIDTPGGKVHVEVDGGNTRITTNDSDSEIGGDTSNKQSGDVSVNLDSHSNGGTTWGSTRVYGFSTSSDNSGAGVSSTSVFSSDSGHVSVSQQ